MKKQVRRPNKYGNRINSINELHDCSDLFGFDKWYN